MYHSFLGLKGLTYVDKTKADRPRVVEENTELSVSAFLDRVYENAPNQIEVLFGGDEDTVIILQKVNTTFLLGFRDKAPYTLDVFTRCDVKEYLLSLCILSIYFLSLLHFLFILLSIIT